MKKSAVKQSTVSGGGNRRMLAPTESIIVKKRSISPDLKKKKPSPPKKKQSPPPSITRPDTPEEALAFERMCLRPKQKSPPEKSEKKSTDSGGGSLNKRGNRRAFAPIDNNIIVKKRSISPKKKTTKKKASPPPPISREEAVKRSEELRSRGPSVETLMNPVPKGKPAKYGGLKVEEGLWFKDGSFYNREAQMAPRQPCEVANIIARRANNHVPMKGFTIKEYTLCRHYVTKQTFECLGSNPDEFKEFKKYVDTVRQTKGYGVTKGYPGCQISPALDSYANILNVRAYIDAGIEVLLVKMKRKFKIGYKSVGVANLAFSAACDTYLLTLKVEEEGGLVEADLTVEALIFGKWRGPEPENSDCLKVTEWKLKRGSQVLHCTEMICD